ncbi:hypothetical protein LTR53_014689 [Teratosphaeriaceae sp. CCFEE 6253]|nr:hypothetical protein LTR53_014689 [Teratosphaeriaceae sp. CCFEE 6253]
MPSLLDRLRLLPSGLLLLSLQHALAGALDVRATKNTTVLAAPIAFPPDESWDGIDGAWSSFSLRIGTPPQTIRTFVSFASFQTLAVLPQGCQAAEDYDACASTRGYIYNETASSTFDQVGLYAWGIEENLGVDGNAIYGYDNVSLGSAGENLPSLANTTVGGFAVSDLYLGVFGVNPKPTNFTNFNEPSPSFMTQLKDQGLISSVSASYTAGAPYRSPRVLASLTLGGYDRSKFVESDVEFTFSPDNSRDLVVGVQSINTPAANSSSPVATELLPGPIYMYVDSTVPQIWLPLESCRVFEYEFGLVYDNTSELYLVNDTLHETLLSNNASITFSLAQSTTGGSTVQITLLYAAFDLTASPPYQGLTNQTRYFPLRRAANDTQYTLGRTFLQEAYLTVDWEAQRFNVSQVNWNQDLQTNLVAIPPFTGASTSMSQGTGVSKKGLSGGAIGGIVAGAVALIAILLLAALWHFRRRSRAAKAKAAENEKLGVSEEESPPPTVNRGQEPTVFIKAELEGSSPMPPADTESDSKRLLSSHGSGPPGTPGTMGAPSTLGGYFPGNNRGSSAYSPSTPTAGEGTHSSTQSHSDGSHTHSSIRSPLSPASEADSKERQVFEMAGDMPTIKEKDGKALSEKEAMARREMIYNGVDSPPHSAIAVDESPTTMTSTEPRERRTVNAEDVVVRADRLAPPENGSLIRHRAFSFEELRGADAGTSSSDELYSRS